MAGLATGSAPACLNSVRAALNLTGLKNKGFVGGICGSPIRSNGPGSSARVVGETVARWQGVGSFRSKLPFESV